MQPAPVELNLFFEKPSPDYTKYCTLFNFAGKKEIMPNLHSDFKECLANYAGVVKMKPRKEVMGQYVSAVAWGMYNSVNMNQQNFSNYLLGGVLTKMVDSKRFPIMKAYWEAQVHTACASFPIHSNTLKLVESILLRGQSANADLNSELRANINDLLYVSYFVRCQGLRELTAEYFMLLAKELMFPWVPNVHRLEKLLRDQNLPNQMVLRLCSTFFVLDSQEKIVVTRSMIVVGDAPTENHMAMIALTQPIEFMSQTTLSRVHVLKPKGLDFSLVFSYAHGLVGKLSQCLLSGVVVEGGGVEACNLEEFAVVNSLIHDCGVGLYCKKVDYLFVGDRDAVSQTFFSARCVQAVQAEDIGSLTVSNVMFQDVGAVFSVGPCSMMEVSNISVLDCGRLGSVHCASPVILSSCSISCVFPNLDTRSHGLRYSMVSVRSDSAFPISDVPVLCMPVQKPVSLSFQPDPLVKRQRMQVDASDFDLIRKMYKDGQASDVQLAAPMVLDAGVIVKDTFDPDLISAEKKQKT